MKYFGEYSGSRDNNFTLLRFIAALFVIISHSVALSLGKKTLEPLEASFGLSLGSVGVVIFFIVSGYLIAMSYCARHDLRAFCVARVLRIFPALCVCTVVSAFIWAPWLSSLGVANYFKDGSVYRYVVDNTVLLLRRGTAGALPGVFTSNPIHDVFNGSLWTLPIELRMYVLVAMVGVAGFFRRRWLINLLLVAGVIAVTVGMQRGALRELLWRPPAFFLAGMLVFVSRDFVPANGFVGMALGVIAALAYKSVLFPILAGAFLVYAVFFLAYVPGGRIRNFNKFGDYSYGLYIYAFPVQQTLVMFHPGIRPLQMFLTAFPITLGIAIISWHLVEKPALGLKERLGALRMPGLRRAMAPTANEIGVTGKRGESALPDNRITVAEMPPR